MNMDSASLAFARVCFFVMLFVSTACSRFDATRLSEDNVLPSPTAATQPAAPAAAHVVTLNIDAAQMHELEARLALLAPESGADRLNAAPENPGRAYWD
ncbi:MAG: hypothetical protein Q8O35_01005 [Humidesulfovibrio sp.]|uniref:hypothetical protein n=1 Tax=Humidesulfovibrio sp. TaxID=2910988 RepID=UPI0027333BDA|nr:hypothetical protein [Humidesulfovibrio sp.]MDP2846749.1 hypothetical protein [Humidesulfovibrio sp.]